MATSQARRISTTSADAIRIKACDLFVFILTGRRGSGAAFVEDRITASYLELELFAAAVLRKPILVLHYAGREPEPALDDTMSLPGLFSSVIWEDRERAAGRS